MHGDELLRADRVLAARLDGVYRRGEIYLRWPQKLSSLAFGTPIGRLFTRYVALPFGTAYIALAGLKYLIELGIRLSIGAESIPAWVTGLDNSLPVLAAGLFLLGVFYHRGFRGLCWRGLRLAGRIVRGLVIDCADSLFRVAGRPASDAQRCTFAGRNDISSSRLH